MGTVVAAIPSIPTSRSAVNGEPALSRQVDAAFDNPNTMGEDVFQAVCGGPLNDMAMIACMKKYGFESMAVKSFDHPNTMGEDVFLVVYGGPLNDMTMRACMEKYGFESMAVKSSSDNGRCLGNCPICTNAGDVQVVGANRFLDEMGCSFVDRKPQFWPMDCKEFCLVFCGNILKMFSFQKQNKQENRMAE